MQKEEDIIYDKLNRYMTGHRLYCVTIKAVSTLNKGSKSKLNETLFTFRNRVQGTIKNISYEKADTPGLHVHFLMESPLIQNKKHVTSAFKGWHFNCQLVRQKDEDEAISNWDRYINKEKSDSEYYWSKYGNMFIPEDQGEVGGGSVAKNTPNPPNIVHFN